MTKVYLLDSIRSLTRVCMRATLRQPEPSSVDDDSRAER